MTIGYRSGQKRTDDLSQGDMRRGKLNLWLLVCVQWRVPWGGALPALEQSALHNVLSGSALLAPPLLRDSPPPPATAVTGYRCSSEHRRRNARRNARPRSA